jgi:hypothetical protein
MTQEFPQELPPKRLAFIMDGKVVEMMNTDDRLAALFLSEPLVVDITERYDTINAVGNVIGMSYDKDKDMFYIPVTE